MYDNAKISAYDNGTMTLFNGRGDVCDNIPAPGLQRVFWQYFDEEADIPLSEVTAELMSQVERGVKPLRVYDLS
jgi:hypothetical protein